MRQRGAFELMRDEGDERQRGAFEDDDLQFCPTGFHVIFSFRSVLSFMSRLQKQLSVAFAVAAC